jgi:hypothetical protein
VGGAQAATLNPTTPNLRQQARGRHSASQSAGHRAGVTFTAANGPHHVAEPPFDVSESTTRPHRTEAWSAVPQSPPRTRTATGHLAGGDHGAGAGPAHHPHRRWRSRPRPPGVRQEFGHRPSTDRAHPNRSTRRTASPAPPGPRECRAPAPSSCLRSATRIHVCSADSWSPVRRRFYDGAPSERPIPVPMPSPPTASSVHRSYPQGPPFHVKHRVERGGGLWTTGHWGPPPEARYEPSG